MKHGSDTGYRSRMTTTSTDKITWILTWTIFAVMAMSFMVTFIWAIWKPESPTIVRTVKRIDGRIVVE